MKKIIKTTSLLLLVLNSTLFAQKNKQIYDIIVAKDGSGTFTKVQDAFDAVPDNSLKRTIIYVKAGVYKEKIKLNSTKQNVMLLGESYKNTILTYDDYAELAGGTSKSFSTLIEANDFYAENITFENTIDSNLPQYKKGGQAVALMVNGDRSIFHNCKISGFQDTFYLKEKKGRILRIVSLTVLQILFLAQVSLYSKTALFKAKEIHTLQPVIRMLEKTSMVLYLKIVL